MTRYIALCKIIECGSFTKAAEALGYTQAAVSQMIRSLENEYALTLLTRTRTGVKLTKEGETLYPVIQKYVSAYRELSDKAGEINGLESGEIRIGVFSSLSQNLLPGLMSDFSKIYPGINFVLHQGDNTTLPEWIKSGIIDFGFVYPEASSGLVNKVFMSDKFVAVLPEEHPLAQKQMVSLTELASEPLILVDEGGINTVQRAFDNANLKARIKYRIHDDFTILSMVEKGIGISVLPSMILERSAYKVKTAGIAVPVVRTVGVAYQSEELLTISAKRFISFMFSNLSSYLPQKNIIM